MRIIIAGDQIAAQRVADLYRQAARQRLLRELRASGKQAVHRAPRWDWLTVRRPWPAVMNRTHQTMDPVVAAVVGRQLAALAESGGSRRARSACLDRVWRVRGAGWPSITSTQAGQVPMITNGHGGNVWARRTRCACVGAAAAARATLRSAASSCQPPPAVRPTACPGRPRHAGG
jgi:hypothetical protein